MRMPSANAHSFRAVQNVLMRRSSFKMDNDVKLTMKAGYLTPVYRNEVLPGDSFNVHGTFFARLATPVFPIMDNMKLDVHFFFVPYRLVWSNFAKFCGETEDPIDISNVTEYTIPQCKSDATGYLNGSLQDHLGLPTLVPNLPHTSMNQRAYNLIYNDYYRDQDLIDSITVDKGDTVPGSSWDDPTDYVLRKRAKIHDYFTSCRPWPQKGAAVTIPVADLNVVTDNTSPIFVKTDASPFTDGTMRHQGAGTVGVATPGAASVGLMAFGSNTGLKTDGAATAVTINQLRQAFQIERIYERDARSGTRYREITYSHFGVLTADSRLQRPEFLGAGTTNLDVNVVPQTSGTDGEPTPLGTLGGFGTFVGTRMGFTKSFNEHGLILGIASIRADITYQQGLPREYSRLTRFDMYWPSLAHLGEQAVYKKEIYAQDPATDTGSTGTADNERVFGYQERYSEYKYKASEIHGFMRSNAGADSLDEWHLSQEFGSLPGLDQTFIEETPPMERIKQVTDSDWDVQVDIYWREKQAKVMPVYSIPGLIDHF